MRKILLYTYLLIVASMALSAADVATMISSSTERLIKNLPPSYRTLYIATLPFGGKAYGESTTKIGLLLSDLYAHFLNKKGFHTLTRQDLKKILKERNLSDLGITEAQKELSKLKAADYLLTGTFQPLNDRIYVVAKLIDINTGLIVSSDELSLQLKPFLSSESIKDLIPEMRYPITAAFRSAILPGWGQFYNDKPVKGGFLATAYIGSIASDIYLYSQWQKYLNTTSEGEEYEKDIKKASDYYNYMLLSLSITAIIWIYSVIDAYLGL